MFKTFDHGECKGREKGLSLQWGFLSALTCPAPSDGGVGPRFLRILEKKCVDMGVGVGERKLKCPRMV